MLQSFSARAAGGLVSISPDGSWNAGRIVGDGWPRWPSLFNVGLGEFYGTRRGRTRGCIVGKPEDTSVIALSVATSPHSECAAGFEPCRPATQTHRNRPVWLISCNGYDTQS